jgi:peptidoglycan/LPS O-acetylase OafA/YrhL
MISYRKDIDGLRALAVLSIFIFHINKSWLPGGFVGVDIFFVISGFLITSIIHTQILNGSFTLKDFYNRRLKRIVPAAMFYTIIIVIVAYIIYLPNDFLIVSKSAIASTVFLSNIYFMRNVDYFSPQAEENPLVHTWSLAVEEQFYVVWPLMLMVLIHLIKSPNRTRWLLIFVTVSAFVTAHALALNPSTQKSAFYLMPTRFGEFLIGCILAMNVSRVAEYKAQLKSFLATTGICILFVSFIFVDEDSVFPGALAFLVCIGTALIIGASAQAQGEPSSLTYKLLSSAPLRYIGKISFSLYLAHWPVLAVARYITQSYELRPGMLVVVIGMTFLLAHLTWKYIETPFRKTNFTFLKSAFAFYALPSFIVACITLYSLTTNGVPSRFNKTDQHFKVASDDICVTYIREDCQIGMPSATATFLLTGDSHGSFYSSFLDALGRSQGFSLDAISANDCAGIFTRSVFNKSGNTLSACSKLKAHLMTQQQEDNYSGFIYAERWEARLYKSDNYLDELIANLDYLEKRGKKVFLLLQVPKYSCDPNRVLLLEQKIGVDSDCTLKSETKVQKANQKLVSLAKQYTNVSTLSVNDFFCQKGQCSTLLDGQIAYADDDHLSLFGTSLLADQLAKKLPPEWDKFVKRLNN